MSRVAKISVQNFDSKEEILYDFDKSVGLDLNILSICRKVNLPPSTKTYGLMYLPIKKDEEEMEHYISEDNFEDIKHNDRLKVVFSLQYILERIVNFLRSTNEDEKHIAFEDISKHSLDPVFIDELERTGIDDIIVKTFVHESLSSDEQLGVIRTVVHLFSREYILDTSKDILSKALSIMKNSDTSNEEIRFALSLLHKILISTNEVFASWKERIIRDVPLSDIVVYTWRDTSPGLQFVAVLLINTIIKECKGEKKQQLIKEMNLKKTRENIYNYIIMPGNLSRKMEHELYVLQTYLLSLFTEALKRKIAVDDNNLFKRQEFEPEKEDMRRLTMLMDFVEEAGIENSNFSVEDLAFSPRNSRLSLASLMSDDSNKSLKRRAVSESDQSGYISYLTLEALRHYKNVHRKNFYHSQIEEHLYEPGIFVTSEKVVKMLAKMLHVGVDPPDSRSTFYQPIAFFCSQKTPFFLELFSRTMWLLSRTRREMKASKYADYGKVMYVLKKQVKMALKTKPKDFKSLTAEMSNISFYTIQEKMQIDREEEMKTMLESHPCLQELKEKFNKPNEELVLEHRIKTLLDGENFTQMVDKKNSQDKKKVMTSLQLSKNMKEFTISEAQKEPVTYSLEDVTHIVIGKNCQHSNLCDTPGQAFCIIIKYDTNFKFKAEEEKTASYWTDGFLLLTKKSTPENLSSYYIEERDRLTEMDIRLQLLELENVHIPKSAPVEPPPPVIVRPEVPPKPNFRRNAKLRYIPK